MCIAIFLGFFVGGVIMYNFEVDDVDLEYEKLTQLGNQAVMPLDNHP